MAHKICGILDAQGFMKDGLLIPREVALKTDTKNVCFLVNTKLCYDELNTRDRITNRYIEKIIIGIPLVIKKDDKAVIDYELEIFKLYHSSKTKEKKLIGIKNHHLTVILNKLCIPWIDLEDFGCQSMDILERLYNESCCAFHHHIKRTCGDWKCAQKKVNILDKWLKTRKTDL